MQRWSAALLMLALFSPFTPAGAQTSTTSALINQQLDRQAKLQLTGTLPEAMSQIAKQTGVPVEADPTVWDLLPWGRETAVTVTIENQTLRQALEAIMRRLGLTFVLKEEALEIQPMPALRRLGRKSTVTELEALNLLFTTPLEFKSDKTRLKDLVEAADQKLEAMKSQYALENRTATSPDKVAQDSPLSIPRNAALGEALEAMVRQTSATWYPWGKTIVILPKQDQVRRMLQKEITLRHEGTDVAQVLTELSTRAGVPFNYEPGSLQELSPQSRNIRLVLNATINDALEAICGLTGLDFMVKGDEVYFWNTAQTTSGARDRGVALIPTEAGIQVIVTESQCPPDIREYIEFQKKKHFAELRKMMAEQGFKPTNPATQPATRPARPRPATKAPESKEPPGKDL